ncbi:MAG: hypothetical protein KKG99_17470 [Bacteroidetes bacterium]|nr:hypothetical protein [Bacteroidota bacterium]
MTKIKGVYVTMGDNPETVNVEEFRRRICHLERIIHVDRHACVGPEEKEGNLNIMKRVGSELINTTCKRATEDDWTRRESIIDRSTTFLIN